jgi:hypothetical protein
VWEKASGQVRAHLREGQARPQSAEPPPPPDSIREVLYFHTNDSADRPLFNQLNEQLKIIGHRLDEQERILTKIIENLELVRGLQLAMLQGAINAALELAERGEDNQDISVVRQAWAELMKGCGQLAALLEYLIGDSRRLGQALRAHKMFALLLCRYHLAARAAARCEWLLFGADAARGAASRFGEQVATLRAAFLSALRNFAEYQQVLVELDPAARLRLRESVRDLLAIEEASFEQVYELEFCAQVALTPDAWRQLPQERPRVLLLRGSDQKAEFPLGSYEPAR